MSAIPFGGYVALPQLADMGRLEGQKEIDNSPYTKETDKDFKWKDVDDDQEDEDLQNKKTKPLPKISYTDKMLVSVMGAVFNMILAFALSAFFISSVTMFRIPNLQQRLDM